MPYRSPDFDDFSALVVDLDHPADQYARAEFAFNDAMTLLRQRIYNNNSLPIVVEGEAVLVDFHDIAIEALDIQPGDSVLETCCGTGTTARAIARANPETEVVAIDISGGSIDEAKEFALKEGLTNITFLEGDVRELTSVLEGRKFNKVFNAYSYYLIDNPQKALDELLASMEDGAMGVILSRGGRNLEVQWNETRRILLNNLCLDPTISPYHRFGIDDIDREVKARFKVVPYQPYDRLLQPGARSVVRDLALDNGDSRFCYMQTLMQNLTASIHAQDPTNQQLAIAARQIVREQVVPRYTAQIDETKPPSKDTRFIDTAEDIMFVLEKPSLDEELLRRVGGLPTARSLRPVSGL